MEKIQAGDYVTHEKYPERGKAYCSYISYEQDNAFLVWGEYDDMNNREYLFCKTSEITKQINNLVE